MSDEQKSSNNDGFIVPKLPFRKPVIDLNDKIDKTQDQIKSLSQSSIQQSSPQEKSLPLPLSSLNPSKDVFSIEIIKDGTVLGREYLNKNRILLGRATDCDLIFEHCSISRHHAMLLWKENASNMEDNGFFYLKDLDSSHGTFLNKVQVESNKFLKLEPNKSFIKLGASSRLLLFSCISNTNESDEEDKPQESVKKEKHQFNFKDKSDDYCLWGMEEFETENSIYSVGQDSGLQIVLGILNENKVIDKTENDNAYISNPQKVIQNWFDYEGYEFEYQISNENNKFKCTIEFPIEDQYIPISGEEEFKKKDAINSACLKACQILDQAEILFTWQKRQKIEKRKQENEEDDEMLDETGERESKKARLEALKNKKVDNLGTLTQRFDKLKTEIETLKADLDEIDREMILSKRTGNTVRTDDELDQYMNTVSATKYNLHDLKIRKSKAKMKMMQLTKEKEQTERLIKIAQPNLCTYKIKSANSSSTSSSSKVNELIQKAQAKLNQKKQEELTEQSKLKNKNKIELNILNNFNDTIGEKTYREFKSTKIKTPLSGFSDDFKCEQRRKPILINLDDENDEDKIEHNNDEDKIEHNNDEDKIEHNNDDQNDNNEDCKTIYKANIDELINLKTNEESIKEDDQFKSVKTEKKQRVMNLKRDETEEIEDDSKFIDWLPPEDIEEEDGKSHLYNKYGY